MCHCCCSLFLKYKAYLKDEKFTLFTDGDPRVPNVILCGEKLLWIDLVEVLETCPTFKQFDADILTRSILKVSLDFELSMTMVHLLESYGKDSTQKNIDHLIKAVCKIMNIKN